MAIYIHTTQILNNFIFSIFRLSAVLKVVTITFMLKVLTMPYKNSEVNKLLCSALATIHARFMNNDH